MCRLKVVSTASRGPPRNPVPWLTMAEACQTGGAARRVRSCARGTRGRMTWTCGIAASSVDTQAAAVRCVQPSLLHACRLGSRHARTPNPAPRTPHPSPASGACFQEPAASGRACLQRRSDDASGSAPSTVSLGCSTCTASGATRQVAIDARSTPMRTAEAGSVPANIAGKTKGRQGPACRLPPAATAMTARTARRMRSRHHASSDG